LIDLAAEALEVDRGALVAADGKITHGGSGRSLTYAELTREKKLAKTVAADIRLTPVDQCKVIGKSAVKTNAGDIVTGRHRYSSDVIRPNMLHGKVLRPPSLNAKLLSADLERARAMEGASVVRDGEFVAVAAPSQYAAEQALDAIRAEWTSPRESSVATLYDDLKVEVGGGRGGFGGRGGQNVGSIDDGLAAADHKLAATYTIAYIAHTPLEPRAAVAEWNDGKLTVWTGTQRPFGVRDELARAFGIAQERVRVIVPDTGSGYGGKHTGEAAVEAARIAKAAGKPVKLVWTREEEFTWAYFRPAGVIEISAGVKNDGTITLWEFHNYNSGGSAIEAPYRIANVRTATHNSRAPLRQGSYRALASAANVFARECHIDDLAHAVKLDPLEFRLKNLRDARVRAVIEAAAKKFGWGEKEPPTEHGYGIAGGTEKGSYVATCAEVAVDRADGTVRVVRLVTAFECGAVVNPLHLENQVDGAVMMGLGGALFEHVDYADGVITNARLADYRVPRFRDLPQLETVLLDRKDLPSAGAGETPIVAVAPAIGNAIYSAVGVRLRSLPMVPNGLKI
jgi:isoquinoline 1-oxidoreductase